MKEFIVRATVAGRGSVRARVKAPDENALRANLHTKGWLIESVDDATTEIIEELQAPVVISQSRPHPSSLTTFQRDAYGFSTHSKNSHQLTSFNPGVLIFLHFVTLGIFPIFHLLWLHSRLPQRRPDDPTGGKAVGLCFVPFYSFYWMPFAFRRLAFRLNELRNEHGLPEAVSDGFVLAMCILFLLPYLNFVAFVFVMPMFCAYLQSSVNELVNESRQRTLAT